MGASLLGSGAGPAAAKASAFDLHGNEPSRAARPVPLVNPDPRRAPEDLSEVRLAEAIGQALTGTSALAAQLVVVAVTGQGDGCWPVDGDGCPRARTTRGPSGWPATTSTAGAPTGPSRAGSTDAPARHDLRRVVDEGVDAAVRIAREDQLDPARPARHGTCVAVDRAVRDQMLPARSSLPAPSRRPAG
jgi:hypothetical protein